VVFLAGKIGPRPRVFVIARLDMGTRRATAVALLSLATCARAYLLTPSQRTARCVPLRMQDAPPAWEPPSVPLQHVQPSPSLTPRDVVNSVMAALHRTNWDTPKPYYGFEVALRFLAPTHMAKVNNAKPGGYSRYLRQPHKVGMILWNEFRFEGDTILLENGDSPDEAYQMCSVRSSPTDEWTAARWKLVKVQIDFGESSFSQWMVDAVFANEPDQYNDEPLKLLSDPPPPPPPPAAAAEAKEVTSLENAWGNADAFAEQADALLILATCYLLAAYLLLATCYLLLATCYLLLATHHAPRTTHHAPRTTHHSPLAAHCSLLAAYGSLLTAYCIHMQ
jgi:hypothetical protein